MSTIKFHQLSIIQMRWLLRVCQTWLFSKCWFLPSFIMKSCCKIYQKGISQGLGNIIKAYNEGITSFSTSNLIPMALYTSPHFHCLIYNCCEVCFTLAYSEISLQFSLNLIIPFPVYFVLLSSLWSCTSK